MWYGNFILKLIYTIFRKIYFNIGFFNLVIFNRFFCTCFIKFVSKLKDEMLLHT